jgi:hypothetical protein
MKEQSYGDFSVFKVGDKVKVISPHVDFKFFSIGISGKVIRNSGKYLGIIVKFDNDLEHGFNPRDLVLIEKDYNKTFVKLLTAFLCEKRLLKKEYGLKKIDKIELKHGTCCTCQDCGQSHDNCVCEHNEWVEFILGNMK